MSMNVEDAVETRFGCQAKEWPVDALEAVGQCPVCGSKQRDVLHRGLKDKIFLSAGGEWSMYKCQACGSAYLDPRPTIESIGMAYRNYFTHKSAQDRSTTLAARAALNLANGYLKKAYGMQGESANWLGYYLAKLFPSYRSIADAAIRHLPHPNPGAKLLDVGCGNGDFLVRAQNTGWQVTGIDPDPKAAAVARSRGLDIRDSDIFELDACQERFDGITLNHVIEHVHDPIATLHACHELLKPGGWLWLETPNINAAGHRRYGESWRGLEPPRHLVLFTRESLVSVMESQGFTEIADMPYRPVSRYMYTQSELIRAGKDQNRRRGMSPNPFVLAIDQATAKRRPELREVINLKAYKK
jgi:2-polyprenyl-3-methyl-5-hydroxy-6-metoxy-1,4-benzoquinol methylase